MRSIFSNLLALFFPARCSACDALGAEPFCDECAETLVAAPAGCPVCGVPLDEALQPTLKPRRCGPCRAQAPPFVAARAPFLHGGALAEAIHALKYERREELARPLGALFEVVERPRADLVCPLPLHPERLVRRGFDQAALLAREAATRFALPLEHVLERSRPTAPQVGRDRKARARNVFGAFRARGDVRGRSICLIDDVLTTGATAGEAARALYAAGARRVEVRTLSRAP
jgi:ComF family protein